MAFANRAEVSSLPLIASNQASETSTALTSADVGGHYVTHTHREQPAGHSVVTGQWHTELQYANAEFAMTSK